MVNTTAKYCAYFNFNITHVQVNVRLDRAMRNIIGTLRATPFLGFWCFVKQLLHNLSQRATIQRVQLNQISLNFCNGAENHHYVQLPSWLKWKCHLNLAGICSVAKQFLQNLTTVVVRVSLIHKERTLFSHFVHKWVDLVKSGGLHPTSRVIMVLVFNLLKTQSILYAILPGRTNQSSQSFISRA